MRFRSVFIGLLLAFLVSTFTYFNDAVIRSTFFVGNFFPIGVFGAAILLLLLLNPLLRLFHPKLPLAGREMLVIIALGLAACAWPSSNFYRGAGTFVTMPPHLEKTQNAWQAQNIMSYVPGGSPLVAQGHVRNWREFASNIVDAKDSTEPTPALRIWEQLEDHQAVTFESASQEAIPRPGQIDSMTRAINQILESPDFYEPEYFAGVELNDTAENLLEMKKAKQLSDYKVQRLNRAILVSSFSDFVDPPPEGEGLLISMDEGGQRVVDMFVEGRSKDDYLSLTELPWSVWWPNIRLLGGLSLALGVASLCLALIVHPQWSKHELLTYPIARFAEEATIRQPGSWLPDVALKKMFWVAFAIVFAIRLQNGFAVWFEGLPTFPLTFDLGALRTLFPNARQVPFTRGVWQINLFPTVIALSFFLSSKVAFSLGISNILWAIFGSILVAKGLPIGYEYVGGKKINLLHFGSYIGMALMIIYTGRRYYANVVAGTFGFSTGKETPVYAVWAGRGLVLCFILSIYLLHTAGLPVFWGTLFILMVLTIFVVASRILCETGAFFFQPYWLPVGILTALFGIEAIGPTPYIVLGVLSLMVVGDPRTTLMPYLSTGLRMVSAGGKTRPAKVVPWLLIVIIGGFIAAGAVTLYFQHNVGANQHDGWVYKDLPAKPFNQLSNYTSDMSARGVLNESTGRSWLERLALTAPEEGAYFWVVLGLGFVLVAAFARLRLPWWPIHPVLFLVWGTYPLQHFSSAFLIGWAIKASVVKTVGAKGFHNMKPLMIGLIAGDLLGGILWITVGLIYYLITGLQPESYWIFPG